MEVLFEDNRFKVTYGASKKGCHSSRHNAPKMIVIDKQAGKPVHENELPVDVLQSVLLKIQPV